MSCRSALSPDQARYLTCQLDEHMKHPVHGAAADWPVRLTEIKKWYHQFPMDQCIATITSHQFSIGTIDSSPFIGDVSGPSSSARCLARCFDDEVRSHVVESFDCLSIAREESALVVVAGPSVSQPHSALSRHRKVEVLKEN